MSGKNIIIGILLLLLVVGGVWVKCNYIPADQPKIEEQSQVLLERIKKVSKLVTIEGYFSEIYDYKEYWGYDYSPFRKKALIRVKAKVSVGYDLKSMKLDAFPEEKKIVISNLPDPKIISIDHDLDYYDITEGSFNAFTKEDYNKMNKSAKEKVEKQALASDLLISAENQGNQVLETITFMVESAGWTVEYETRNPVLND